LQCVHVLGRAAPHLPLPLRCAAAASAACFWVVAAAQLPAVHAGAGGSCQLHARAAGCC
jgi:hypothetical protein